MYGVHIQCVQNGMPACRTLDAGIGNAGTRHPVERAFTEDGKLSPSANAGPGPLNQFS